VHEILPLLPATVQASASFADGHHQHANNNIIRANGLFFQPFYYFMAQTLADIRAAPPLQHARIALQHVTKENQRILLEALNVAAVEKLFFDFASKRTVDALTPLLATWPKLHTVVFSRETRFKDEFVDWSAFFLALAKSKVTKLVFLKPYYDSYLPTVDGPTLLHLEAWTCDALTCSLERCTGLTQLDVKGRWDNALAQAVRGLKHLRVVRCLRCAHTTALAAELVTVKFLFDQ
jgi:hypothetical protein